MNFRLLKLPYYGNKANKSEFSTEMKIKNNRRKMKKLQEEIDMLNYQINSADNRDGFLKRTAVASVGGYGPNRVIQERAKNKTSLQNGMGAGVAGAGLGALTAGRTKKAKTVQDVFKQNKAGYNFSDSMKGMIKNKTFVGDKQGFMKAANKEIGRNNLKNMTKKAGKWGLGLGAGVYLGNKLIGNKNDVKASEVPTINIVAFEVEANLQNYVRKRFIKQAEQEGLTKKRGELYFKTFKELTGKNKKNYTKKEAQNLANVLRKNTEKLKKKK